MNCWRLTLKVFAWPVPLPPIVIGPKSKLGAAAPALWLAIWMAVAWEPAVALKLLPVMLIEFELYGDGCEPDGINVSTAMLTVPAAPTAGAKIFLSTLTPMESALRMPMLLPGTANVLFWIETGEVAL